MSDGLVDPDLAVSSLGPRGETRRSKKGGTTKKRRRRPKALMIQIYHVALQLIEQGYSVKQIVEIIYETFGVTIYQSTVVRWMRGERSPYRMGLSQRRRFRSLDELEPSPELAYVIGVVFGDGSVYLLHYRRKWACVIQLIVRDLDFAMSFAQALAKVLNRDPPPILEMVRDGKTFYVVRVRDIILTQLLIDRDIERIRKFVEHDEQTKVAFLRGFFDSEGSVGKSGVILYNTNVDVLRWAQELLEDLGIMSTGPYLHIPAGTSMEIGGGVSSKDCYRIRIRNACLPLFLEKVGFSIERKLRRLEEIVRERMLRLRRRWRKPRDDEEIVEEEVAEEKAPSVPLVNSDGDVALVILPDEEE
ncbi:MAG: LAGLIDADG family homing endonuclease [Candidatus Caldarchaeales archaeon]